MLRCQRACKKKDDDHDADDDDDEGSLGRFFGEAPTLSNVPGHQVVVYFSGCYRLLFIHIVLSLRFVTTGGRRKGSHSPQLQ